MAIQKISNAVIADNAIDSDNLVSGAVNAADITDGTIAPSKLSAGHPNWDALGKVGIGINDPDGALHIKSDTNKTIKLDATLPDGDGSFTSLSFARNGTDKWRIFQYGNDNGLLFRNDLSATNQLYLSSNGGVGIGHTAAGSKLHVRGDSNSSFSDSAINVYNGTSGGGLIISAANSGNQIGAFAGSVIQAYGPNNGTTPSLMIGTDYSSPIVFSSYYSGTTSYTERVRINGSNGNVGIGTDNPQAKLEVTGTISSTGSAYTVNATGANFGFYNAGVVPVTYAQMPLGGSFQVWTPGTSGVLTVKDNGNVGIGVDNPVTKLQVAGNMLSQKVFVGDYNGDGSSARQVIGWYQTSGNASTTYRHIRTTMWGGGSTYGNSQYIMGGFHIQSYRYVQSAGQSDAWITFHNWSGSVQNGYNYVYYGNWDAGSYVYVDSTGYVTLRLSNGSYHGHHVDLHQFPIYPVRDIRVSAVIDSNSSTI